MSRILEGKQRYRKVTLEWKGTWKGSEESRKKSLYIMLKIFFKIFLILAHGFGDFRLWPIDLAALDLCWSIMARAHRTVNLHDGGAVLQPPPQGYVHDHLHHSLYTMSLTWHSLGCILHPNVAPGYNSEKKILSMDYDTKQCKNKEHSGIEGHKRRSSNL